MCSSVKLGSYLRNFSLADSIGWSKDGQVCGGCALVNVQCLFNDTGITTVAWFHPQFFSGNCCGPWSFPLPGQTEMLHDLAGLMYAVVGWWKTLCTSVILGLL